MSDHGTAYLEDMDEISDGRCPLRPVRHHFGDEPAFRDPGGE